MLETTGEIITLRAARRRKLYTLQELADAAGVTIKTVTAIEAGRSRPRLSTIRKLAAALDVEPLQVQEFIDAVERGRFAERPAQ